MRALARRAVAPFRALTLTWSKADVVAVALIAATLATCVAVGQGTFSFGALAAAEMIFFGFYLVGSVIASWTPLAAGVSFDLPLRLLVGYVVVNTAMLGLAWGSPLGIVAHFLLVVSPALFVLLAAGRRQLVPGTPASWWLVGLLVVATTLWCQDSIRPLVDRGDLLVFKPWVDGFYHAVHIRMFGAAHGASSLEDFRLAGLPARPYHYGVYLFPAFIKQVGGLPAYTAFAAVLAPVGVFFTGLAAYAFFASLWGPWSGFAAAAALLLFPDGAQQGFGNPFLSYHWLTQISPSATYGLAVLAVAWLFVLKGCARGSRVQVLAGWVFAAIVVAYKVHYVIASALLFLLVPALFFPLKVARRGRALAVLAASAIYVLALWVASHVPGMPLIRLDGSGAGEILKLVQSFAQPGRLLDVFAPHVGPQRALATNLLYGVPYVLLAAFGVLGPLLAVLVASMRRRLSLLERVFPLLLLANFLVMFFGLALDFESSTPDELSHRPILIVYFFVVAWTGGALAKALFRAGTEARFGRLALMGTAALLLVTPAVFGPGVQLMWAMPRLSPLRVSAAVVHAADYIRTRGAPDDVFQDSQFDAIYTVAALSERRAWLAHTLTRMPFRADIMRTRENALEHFMGLGRATLIRETAHALGFRWFLLHRGDPVAWPAEIADHPVFEEGPIKLYDFGN
jgi:hypothetical protein